MSTTATVRLGLAAGVLAVLGGLLAVIGGNVKGWISVISGLVIFAILLFYSSRSFRSRGPR